MEDMPMSGVGKFKLTDALPKSKDTAAGDEKQGSGIPTREKGRARVRSKKASPLETTLNHEQAAEQLREARESAKAKNAEASVRSHMVDIGRGNQQAGRQKAK
jgi:hypothetical protein